MVESTHIRKRRTYGSKSRRPLSATKKILIDEILPEVRINTNLDRQKSICPQALFNYKIKEVWLEIGFGSGEHILWQLTKNKDIGIIGCETYKNGIAQLLFSLQKKYLNQIKIIPDHVTSFLELLQEESISRVFILFSDPWPKKRHSKRRIINSYNLDLLANILVDHGELRIATDHSQYKRWILYHLINHPKFEWTAIRPDDFNIRPEDWPQTKYDKKALLQNRVPMYLTIKRLKR